MSSPVAARGRRRLLLGVLGVALVAVSLAGPASRLAWLYGASDWGSDWRWIQDGLGRLAAGLPLTRPEYVAGPFSQFDPGPAFTWSLHPPFVAALVAPMLLLPEAAREATWTVVLVGALAAAFWLAWPRGLWRGTNVFLAGAVLGTPWIGLWMPIADQVHFANPDALVALGVALTWLGRRRDSAALVAAGLVLAAVKIVPAFALGCWLLAGVRGAGATPLLADADRSGTTPPRTGTALRGILLAVAGLAILTAPVLALDPGALADTIRANANLVPVADGTNFAPRLLLEPLVGTAGAVATSWAAAAVLLGVVLVRRMDGPAGLVLASVGVLFMTPQLWSHWLVIPGVAVLIATGAWPPLRHLDARLRATWDGSPTAGRARPSAAMGT